MSENNETKPSIAAKYYDALFERVAERAIMFGISSGVRAYKKEKEKEKKERLNRRLHNTKLLFKNYRSLKNHVRGAVFEAKSAQSATEILCGLNENYFSDNVYVDSIRQSQQRTMTILAHIDRVIEIYEIWTEKQETPEVSRRFQILKKVYIDDDGLTIDGAAFNFNIDQRTAYRDINTTIEELTPLIFGIDSLNLR